MCRKQERLRLFASDIYLEGIIGSKVAKYIARPCVDIQRLLYNYDENAFDSEKFKKMAPEISVTGNDSILLNIVDYLDQNFKEIKQVRAFGFESLIGNIGGYIGLFLGASIIQLPAFVQDLKRLLFHWKEKIVVTN